MRKIGVVLVVGGHDPSGGAGVGADTQTVNALGGHAVSIITAITVQNTRGVSNYHALQPDLIRAQGNSLIRDCEIAAIKTGMLVNAEIVKATCELIDQCPAVPVVVDPVFVSGSGHPLADPSCAAAVLEHLVPRARVVTPNFSECDTLLGGTCNGDPGLAAVKLLDNGCGSVLITGTDGTNTHDVVHRHYDARSQQPAEYRFPRLAHDYHGSGCTLASALSTYLAANDNVAAAIQSALDYTWETLRSGYAISDGQHIPQRNIAARQNDD